MASQEAKPRPFRISIPDADVDDLAARLRATRWPDQIKGSGWTYGADTTFVHDLAGYWASDYDWRAREAMLNDVPQFTAEVDGGRLHFIHVRSGDADAMPLLLLHGWPGSFVQMLPLIAEVSRPADGPRFDIVVPSLPGYGFSAIPTEPGMSGPRIARLLHALMTEVLGYERYGMRSSDLGAGVAARIGADHPTSIIGSHTGGTNPYLQQTPDDLSPDEQTFVQRAQQWMQTEMGYAQEQSSKPQTLAHALNDSPAGLAAWIIEKFWRWGDTSLPLDQRFDRDLLLDNLSVYWFTRTIGASMRLYYETVRDPNAWARADVPTAMLMSPHDLFPTPRAWAERQGRVDRWTEIDRGGHFLEMEAPDLVAEDLRAFFGGLG